MAQPKKVLVVDDHTELVELIVGVLEQRGFAPLRASRGKQALAIAKAEQPQLAIVDLMLPDIVGYHLIDTLQKEHRIPSIVMSGVFRGANFAAEATSRDGVLAFFEKPFSLDRLIDTVVRQLGQSIEIEIELPEDGSLEQSLKDRMGAHAMEQVEQSTQYDMQTPRGPAEVEERKSGRLGPATFPRLLTAFYTSQQTARLVITAGSTTKTIHFRDGLPVFATSSLPSDFLGGVLVRRGVISEAKRIELVSQLPGEDADEAVGQILVQIGVLTEDVLAAYVREQVRQIIYSLMLLESGDYTIDAAPSPVRFPIQWGGFPANIIMAAVRALYDTHHLKRLLSADRKFIPSPTPVYDLHALRITEREARLLPRVDGTRSVAQLCQLGILTESETYALLYGLAVLGFLAAKKD